ncbi:MAG: hypothetical protein V1743_01615 [Nanoarchaeota archaeon]
MPRPENGKQDSKEGLETKLLSKLQPAIDCIMQKFMGVHIKELGEDLTAKLSMNPLLGFEITTHLPYKMAKKRFREHYIRRNLLMRYGNISEVARRLDVERRTIHRFIHDARMNVQKMRDDMLKPSYIKETAVQDVLGDVLQGYAEVLHPVKLEKMYADLSQISKDIAASLPDNPMSLKEAEEEFEKQYFTKLLGECGRKIVCVAKRAGMRYETVHRKMRKIGVI